MLKRFRLAALAALPLQFAQAMPLMAAEHDPQAMNVGELNIIFSDNPSKAKFLVWCGGWKMYADPIPVRFKVADGKSLSGDDELHDGGLVVLPADCEQLQVNTHQPGDVFLATHHTATPFSPGELDIVGFRLSTTVVATTVGNVGNKEDSYPVFFAIRARNIIFAHPSDYTHDFHGGYRANDGVMGDNGGYGISITEEATPSRSITADQSGIKIPAPDDITQMPASIDAGNSHTALLPGAEQAQWSTLTQYLMDIAEDYSVIVMTHSVQPHDAAFQFWMANKSNIYPLLNHPDGSDYFRVPGTTTVLAINSNDGVRERMHAIVAGAAERLDDFDQVAAMANISAYLKGHDYPVVAVPLLNQPHSDRKELMQPEGNGDRKIQSWEYGGHTYKYYVYGGRRNYLVPGTNIVLAPEVGHDVDEQMMASIINDAEMRAHAPLKGAPLPRIWGEPGNPLKIGPG